MQVEQPFAVKNDVHELMVAKDEIQNAWTAGSSDGDAVTTVMLAALKLSPDKVEAKFEAACHFVAVVLSRVRRDPSSVEVRLWEIETQANNLWALQQQACVGPCEASRGTKEYAMAMHIEEIQPRGFVRWAPCCARVTRESKIKQWQALENLSPLDAQLRYIRIVSEIAPVWAEPISNDSALLRTWTPDDESDRCTICEEVFTFLNRRHHCRRCSNLVCAVCSPYSMPLRVFSQAVEKPQRICTTCYHEMDHQRSRIGSGNASHGVRLNGINIHDPKAEESMRRPSEVTYSFTMDDESDEPTEVTPSLSPPPPAALLPASTFKHSLSTVSATIHCGHLEFLHGTGFRKNWHAYFFVLLIRKGSLGMFLTETDHVEKKKRPAAVYKLSGYTIRIKSQKRRPHQFRLSHDTKKPLHFAAPSIEDMNLWISQFIKAIDNANDLEAASPQGINTTTEVRVEDDEAVV